MLYAVFFMSAFSTNTYHGCSLERRWLLTF